MASQIERAHLLKDLHIRGSPLILFNVWDAGSAQAIQEAGAKAIATGSWSVAAAHGFDDGEKIPFPLVLANFKRIIERIDLPSTFDLEGGYGKTPTELYEKMIKVIKTGAVGINFEDQVIGGDELYSMKEQTMRIKAVRKAAEDMSVPLFINARTDIFLKIDPANHDESHLTEALHRASAYAESGADGFFVPGLENLKYIEKLCKLSPVPVNIMGLPGITSSRKLSELGVARISYGPGPYRLVMDALKEAGHRALQ